MTSLRTRARLNSHQQLRLSRCQQQAVDSNASALTIIAGAGTGKTEVISQRVQRILSQSPYEEFKVLALSYTVRAAEELKERLHSRLESLDELERNGGFQRQWGIQTLSRLQRRVVTNTIHGFILTILQNHGTRIGLPIEPEILSRDEDRQELLSSWVERNGYRALQDPARTLRRFDLERAQQLERAQRPEPYNPYRDPHVKMWRDALAESGTLDYPAIIERCIELMDIPGIRRIYTAQYRHVIIDEAQNLTKSQYRLVTALIGHPHTTHINTVLSGDERQSIVGFAGADHTLISKFEQQYHAERIELDRNFRSAELIDGIA